MTAAPPKRNTKIFVAMLAVLAVGIFKKYKTLADQGSLNMKWKLKIKGTVLNPQLIAYFNYVNPTPTEITVSAIRGQLLYKGSAFAYVNEMAPINILPNATTEIPVAINTRLSDLLIIIPAIKQGAKLSDFVFKGSFTVFGVEVPVEQTLSL